jgi:CBS domain containing-hemolysin-like protein
MDAAAPIAIAMIAAASVALLLVAGAETALERSNDVRIQALAARGEARARRIAANVHQPAIFLGPLTTCRVLLAATIVSLAGYLGVREYGALEGTLVVGLAGGGLFVALLELTAGLVAARSPEYAALQLSMVVRVVGAAFVAPAWVLGLPSRLVARSIRAVKRDIDDDILTLLEHEEASGGVEEEEQRMIRGIIGLEDKCAREIMVPRIDIAAVDIEDSIDDVARLITERGYSRVPVYRGTIDDVVGIVYAKDLLRAITNGGRERKLADLLRTARFVPESKRLDELLTEMRATRTHLAIVVDEYGGTAGLVTIEDLLEEIVGEIEDEYDVSAPGTEVLSEDEALIDGGVSTDVLKELFDYEVDSEEFDTVGGLLMNRLGRLPMVGDSVVVDGLELRVLSMSGRRIKRLRVARIHEETPAEAAAR